MIAFQGDFLRTDIKLPEAQSGDWLVIYDTGAYTSCMYSRFHSHLPTPILGYRRNQAGKITLETIKKAENMDEFLAFYGY